ncbi:MAG: hypothetical protein C0466_07720 [Candidatus Accumulibacter sp.]|nr:hypothetical protein [Accumulibacter sp.]
MQPETHPVHVNEDAVRADLAAIDALPALEAGIQESTVALARQLSYDGALTVGGLEEEIRFYQRRSVEAVLELGKRLMLLKELAGHGCFIESLERLGIERTMATRIINATQKFSNVASTQLLTLPKMNQTKLLELLVLDDDEVEALAEGETVCGINKDDVNNMSVSELRRAIRQARAEKEAGIAQAKAGVSGELAAKDRLIAEGKKRIAELVEEKNKRECMTEGELTAELERALSEATLLAVGALIPARKVVDRLRALDHCPQGLYVAAQGALHRIVTEVQSIALDYGIGLDFGLPAGDADPDFGDGLDDPNAGEVFGNESGLGQQG